MTDPATFHAMLSLESPRIYLLMGAAVAVAFVGARPLRGHRALLTGEPIGWTSARPTRSHITGVSSSESAGAFRTPAQARLPHSSARAAFSQSQSRPACSSASSFSGGSSQPSSEGGGIAKPGQSSRLLRCSDVS